MPHSTSKSSLPLSLLTAILLGSTLVISRFSLGQFPTQTYVAMRLATGSLCFLVAYFVFRTRPWPRRRGLWLRAGIFGLIATAITMTSFTQSLSYQSSGVTVLLATLSPIETALLAHLFLKDEPFRWWHLAGAALAFCGAGFLLLKGENGLATLAQADWRGYAWALLGTLTNSIGLVYARRYLRNEDSFTVTSIRIMVGAATIALITGLTTGFDLTQVHFSGILALLYAGIAGTFLAFLFYLTSVQRFGATAASQTEYFVPMVAASLGALLLGELVTGNMLLGMGLIILGLVIFDRGGQFMIWLRRSRSNHP